MTAMTNEIALVDSDRGTIRHEKVTGHIRSGKGNVRLATNLGSVRGR